MAAAARAMVAAAMVVAARARVVVLCWLLLLLMLLMLMLMLMLSLEAPPVALTHANQSIGDDKAMAAAVQRLELCHPAMATALPLQQANRSTETVKHEAGRCDTHSWARLARCTGFKRHTPCTPKDIALGSAFTSEEMGCCSVDAWGEACRCVATAFGKAVGGATCPVGGATCPVTGQLAPAHPPPSGLVRGYGVAIYGVLAWLYI